MRLLVPIIGLLLACVVADYPAARVSEDTFIPKDYAPMKNAMYVYDDQENRVQLTLEDDEEDNDQKLNETLNNIANQVLFFLHTDISSEPTQLYVDDNEVLRNSKFDPKKLTYFVTHGWKNSRNNCACTCIRDAYIQHGDYNVIVIDWSDISMGLYMWASKRVKIVANFVTKMIDFLAGHGLDPSRITLVGHSLGAHVCGLAARSVKSGRVNHVVGLDPALPNFNLAGPGNRVSKDDANYVEIIHTNGGMLGFLTAIGDVDFYPNGGSKQKGCLIDLGGACSHARSYRFYAESITSKVGFYAKKCKTFFHWKMDLCYDQHTSLMGGIKRIFRASGKYFLNTRSTFPFAKGIKGQQPVNILEKTFEPATSPSHSNE